MLNCHALWLCCRLYGTYIMWIQLLILTHLIDPGSLRQLSLETLKFEIFGYPIRLLDGWSSTQIYVFFNTTLKPRHCICQWFRIADDSILAVMYDSNRFFCRQDSRDVRLWNRSNNWTLQGNNVGINASYLVGTMAKTLDTVVWPGLHFLILKCNA